MKIKRYTDARKNGVTSLINLTQGLQSSSLCAYIAVMEQNLRRKLQIVACVILRVSKQKTKIKPAATFIWPPKYCIFIASWFQQGGSFAIGQPVPPLL